MTTDDFIKKSVTVHNNKYDYSLTEYINSRKKVKIICPIHGEFEQTARNHTQGSGCQKCGHISQSNKISNSQNDFIEKVKLLHNNKYDYSKVEYSTLNSKIKIICPIHGEFDQIARNHTQGYGCQKCGDEKVREIAKSRKYTTSEFIEKGECVHNNRYTYPSTEYINSELKVKIVCPIHGEFEQVAKSHIEGHGCHLCSSESKGENKIFNYLSNNDIKFEREKRFDNCRNKLPLPFDFYLPEFNVCIEYDGIQHFESVEYFGGEKNLTKIKTNDIIKNKFCKINNIVLIRIPYWEYGSLEAMLMKILF